VNEMNKNNPTYNRHNGIQIIQVENTDATK